MGSYIPDQSGINSLGGFAYQIRLFVYYMLSMEENMSIGFEVIDDISIKTLTTATLDRNEDKFRNLLRSPSGIKAIQSKRTTISQDTARQILLNWILLAETDMNITDYILCTDSSYGNSDIIFNTSAEDLYQKVISSEKSSQATISKVKNKYKDNKEEFIYNYNHIKKHYTFSEFKNLDDEIDEKCRILFKKAGVNVVTYYNRIKELLNHITCEIIDSVNQRKPFNISYEEFICYAEDICVRFTDQYMYPAYAEFKKLNQIDFADLEVAKSREYEQLLACELPQNLIETHLQYANYYQNVCYNYLELNKVSRIQDIEQTTYDNFESVKYTLQMEGNDTPAKRLVETKKQSNSYADSEQIKYGSGIYLTRADETEHQISWEDEDNAKT